MKSRLFRILILLCLAGIILITMPVSADTGSGENTLTRGGRFSITITGNPNTPYYFWLARTFSMSGKPGDQPPVVQANQLGVEQDPSDGPYTIGNYAYYNGNGRTILEDVAPSTASMPNTSYYGKVTTGADGRATVTFLTSSATAARSFSVKTENPANPGSSNALVEEAVYSRTVPATPVVTRVTLSPTPVRVPVTEPRVIASEVPATIVTTTPLPSPTRADLMTGIVVSALSAAFLVHAAQRRQRR